MFFQQYLIIINAGTWIAVLSSPMEGFLAVRSRRCALAGGSAELDARRQTDLPPGSAALRSGKGLDAKEMSLLKKYYPPAYIGPEIKPSEGYDPTPGYEPYWLGGGWTLKKIEYPKNETKDDDYCGFRCNVMFRTYGQICARNKKGKYMSYKNYCHMVASDCLNKQDWMIIHKGDCYKAHTYDPLARKQSATHEKLVRDFFKKFSRPIGSGISVTEKWSYQTYYDDAGKKKK